ncbi:MAG: type III-B CRISPR module-associated protein Cmr5 [Chloroflexales bacterium]|nr:type III-B CRISPR module-associated protein Cmr5 [Chloroflexales bacterium]
MHTREQRYAQDVYKRVCAIKDAGDTDIDRKKYGGMAHKLPILIRTAGLAQALTFVEARGDKSGSQCRLLHDLGATVGYNGNLAAEARNAELAKYMRLTQQVLDALLWYKRFAQSVLGVESGQDEKDGRDD